MLRTITGLAALICTLLAAPLTARALPPSARDSFRLGEGGGVLCQAQSLSADPAFKSMFDRGYSIACRDAAVPVGRAYALRKNGDDPAARLSELNRERVVCAAGRRSSIRDLGDAAVKDCRLKDGNADYRTYSLAKGRTLYVAEGLTGYDSALQLALRTIVTDRLVPGVIDIATTGLTDATAFARVQAGALDPDSALAEGYRRNNSGSYAEAAEFFDSLSERGNADTPAERRKLGEYIANRALQKSNLGAFAEADALFDQIDRIPTTDPVQLRLRRNLKTLHLINKQRLKEALALLDRSAEPTDAAQSVSATPEIDADLADAINAAEPLARKLGLSDNVALSPQERAAILDAQALALRGTVLRLGNDPAGAKPALEKALTGLTAIRQGRVVSITRLRAQTMAELAAVREMQGDMGGAERLLRDSVALLSGEYPGSPALSGAQARLAGFLARSGNVQAALAMFRTVILSVSANGGSAGGFVNLLAPYFALLAQQIPSQPELVNDFFLASETLVRPGVADTQAVLARELSGGSDEAARLFRQSLDLSRDIERQRVEAARLSAIEARTTVENDLLAATRAKISTLERDQAGTQASLSQFPRYQAVSNRPLTLPELQAMLKPGETYVRTTIVGNAVYLTAVTQHRANVWLTSISSTELERSVDTLRDTISTVDAGQLVTYPFNVALARALYVDLFGQAEDMFGETTHLIFEPDGALLRLPIDLLVTDQASVDAYSKRTAARRDAEFDFRGVQWLGRRSRISTAVSARGFRDVRATVASAAPLEYLGLGSNAPVSPFIRLTRTRSISGDGAIDCSWPLTEWNKPIAATELIAARREIGADSAALLTGAAFSDTAVQARDDLNRYRVLHFATHGLVSAPRPECPARPALLTSFGGPGSDGLLSFAEIFDLRLDADLVILSACDTAGKATVAATREAGVTSGGGMALDGLVRAFVGAGARSVLASHWPAPDDYQATERLISGLFEVPPGTSVAGALKTAQERLMDQADTSHPYYWAGFAIIGDGARPVLPAR